MARSSSRRTKVRGVVSAVVVIALLIASITGLVTLFNKDTKKISPTAFDVGAINADGNFVESDRSIYTKDLIECQGLMIEPDFEAAGTYQVFYYGEDKNFIGATEVMNSEDGTYTKGSTFPVAKYCRIMITPDVPTDEDGDPEDDFKIRFYNVIGYANNYTITVDKDQDFDLVNYFVEDEEMAGKMLYGAVGEALISESNSPFGCIEPIDVSSFEAIRIVFPENATDGMHGYYFLDSDGVIIANGGAGGKADDLELAVPEGATQFVCYYKLGHTFSIYQSK